VLFVASNEGMRTHCDVKLVNSGPQTGPIVAGDSFLHCSVGLGGIKLVATPHYGKEKGITECTNDKGGC
jgi:hypothetical protein